VGQNIVMWQQAYGKENGNEISTKDHSFVCRLIVIFKLGNTLFCRVIVSSNNL